MSPKLLRMLTALRDDRKASPRAFVSRTPLESLMFSRFLRSYLLRSI